MSEYKPYKDPKAKTFAVSYAKDWCIEFNKLHKDDPGIKQKTPLDVLKIAETWRQYMDGELNNVQALDDTE